MEQIYTNRIPGQERIHIEVPGHEIFDVLDDFAPAADAFEATKGLHRILTEAGHEFAPTLVERARPEPDQTEPTVADDAWGSVWLHGNWTWLTKNMTTSGREHAADAVARWNRRLAEVDGDPDRGEPEGLRWWREA